VKPRSTLEDALKPPFLADQNTGKIYDSNAVAVASCHVAEFEGFANRLKLQGDWLLFASQAFDAQWEQFFGEPLRWILVKEYPDDCAKTCCPRCGCNVCQIGHGVDFYDYCPSCGVRLLAPEEKCNA